MSSLFKQFKMDAAKEESGVLLTYGANDDGSVPSFRVLRRANSNQRYAKTLARESQPYRRLIDLGTLDNYVSDRVFMRVFCTSVLIGWENVQDQNAQPIAFNVDNAITLFTELPELYDDLVAQASKASLFLAASTESDAKNS